MYIVALQPNFYILLHNHMEKPRLEEGVDLLNLDDVDYGRVGLLIQNTY